MWISYCLVCPRIWKNICYDNFIYSVMFEAIPSVQQCDSSEGYNSNKDLFPVVGDDEYNSPLFQCMDFGYHNSVGRTMMMYLSVHEQLKQTHQSAIESINKNISDLDSRADKQKFMELNNQMFMLPKKFEFQPFKGDEVSAL